MIQVENVTKKYGSFVAVNKINFEIEEGEIVGFLGPNGAGKSTTMNMITGFIEPSEGSVMINGNDISKKAKKAKRQIGYMPENVPLYSELTVKEFVKYMAELKRMPRKQRKEDIEKVLKETGLEEVQNKLIRNLSRGYKQRVSLAGALIGNPEVLILDEPTVGLDPKQIIEIRNLIKELGKNHTVILSTHILPEVSPICERVIIINKGKIVAIDTPEHLEERTKEENVILLTVEDKEEHMGNVKEKLSRVKEIKMIKDNEDGTKQYMITSDAEVDLRKDLFDILPKQNITIFELKKAEATLEDAFIRLINAREEIEKATENIQSEKQDKIKDKEEKKKAKEKEKEEKKKQKAENKKERGEK